MFFEILKPQRKICQRVVRIFLVILFLFRFWISGDCTSLLDARSSLRSHTELEDELEASRTSSLDASSASFLNKSCDGDVEDEPLSGLVDNPGAATVSISSELNSFLLIMCIGPPESTTNSRSSGLVEVGAAIALAQIGVQNVALPEYLSLHILFAKSHAALRAHLSWCKVSSCDLFPNFGAQGLRS